MQSGETKRFFIILPRSILRIFEPYFVLTQNFNWITGKPLIN